MNIDPTLKGKPLISMVPGGGLNKCNGGRTIAKPMMTMFVVLPGYELIWFNPTPQPPFYGFGL